MKKFFTLLIVTTLLLISGLSLKAQNNCLNFPGSGTPSAVATIPSTTALGFATGGFTLEAWVYPTAWRTNSYEGTIIGKEEDNGSTGWILRCGATGTISFNFAAASAWHEITAPSGSLVLNQWQHVAAVYTGTTQYIYVNGVQKGTGSYTGTLSTNTYNIGIGQWTFDATSRYFPGMIDEVRLWNTPVSAANIANWANRTITSAHPNYANLLGYYKMDDATAGVLTATVGTNGTITLATYTSNTNSSFFGNSNSSAFQPLTTTLGNGSTNNQVL